IDPAVSNLSRLARLPGTVNHKPHANSERPNRPARIIKIDTEAGTATREMLQAVVDVAAELDAQVEAQPEPQRRMRGDAGGTGPAAYIRAALAGECDKIRGTAPGGRHAQI